ncbi:SRPBCC family protein [Ornithinimicrobium cerasi]|uniref:SRPBCC family protein n=1 Tax=Ornithinimicrobium cerasi TaxID=2248773 RepID=UPI00137ACE1D|nr:SRPBCC family protein [Ornithinimicrobium cerasi]
MIVVSRGRSTAAPEQVWAVLSDVDAWPRWVPTVTSVARASGPDGTPTNPATAPGVGSVFEVVQSRLGRARWVVTEWEVGRSFTWVSWRPGVRSTATHRLRAEQGGTGIELGISWSGQGARVVRALVGRLTQRYTELELGALVATAEGRSDG